MVLQKNRGIRYVCCARVVVRMPVVHAGACVSAHVRARACMFAHRFVRVALKVQRYCTQQFNELRVATLLCIEQVIVCLSIAFQQFLVLLRVSEYRADRALPESRTYQVEFLEQGVEFLRHIAVTFSGYIATLASHVPSG